MKWSAERGSGCFRNGGSPRERLTTYLDKCRGGRPSAHVAADHFGIAQAVVGAHRWFLQRVMIRCASNWERIGV